MSFGARKKPSGFVKPNIPVLAGFLPVNRDGNATEVLMGLLILKYPMRKCGLSYYTNTH